MKILEITAFSAGVCGVWTRVKQEALELSKKGHEVFVFSSNITRGCGSKNALAKSFEKIEGVKIYRFQPKGSFGENTFFWNFEKMAERIKPDIIITHAYRQYYSTIALKVAEKMNIPCILVTHAPFLEKKLRNWKLNLAVSLYDNLIGKKILGRYSKILAITKWEYPFLKALNVKKDNVVYIPNGIPDEFFKRIAEPKNKIKKIIFLGRIAPIKDIETLIRAFSIINAHGNAELELIGPVEKSYEPAIKSLIKKLGITVKISGPVYDLKKKISALDSADIFVLPSKREAMPQALIEAMARGKLVITSDTDGGKEIVADMKTGLMFRIGDENQLAEKLKFALGAKNKKAVARIRKSAAAYVRQFAWKCIINRIEGVIEDIE